MAEKSYQARIGKLTFTQESIHSYATHETVEKLFDEMGF
jgi:hypothetical protein